VSRLGEYMVERSLLTREQLLEAERSQAEYGGRLGTNLIKLGLMELEELAAHLSDVNGVPLPPTAWLEEPEKRAAQVLPMPLIRRYKLLPLALEKTRIHVAMLDPLDAMQLDFVATASDREVVPYVLPELRLLYWLENHLGIDRHPRYVSLTALSRKPGLLEEAVGGGDAAGAATRPESQAPGLQIQIGDEFITVETRDGAAAVRPDARGAAVKEEAEPISIDELLEDTAAATVAPKPARSAAAPPHSSSEVAALEAEIHGAGDRDAIVDLGLRLARAHARAAALFLVRGGVVVSYRGDGNPIPEPLPPIELPILTESLFTQPAAALTPFRGEPPDTGIDGRLLRSLGRDGVLEVLVLPIMIRGRVVNLLYADNGPDPFGETSVAALKELCQCISRGYERLILARKADAA